jgi:hypothetical protein
MNDEKARYEIRVACVQAPDSLMGVPLPVDVVSASGMVVRTVVTVGQKDPTIVSVKKPGRYLVRAELPSGPLVAEEIAVPDATDEKGLAFAAVPLDLRAEQAAKGVVKKDQPLLALGPSWPRVPFNRQFNRYIIMPENEEMMYGTWADAGSEPIKDSSPTVVLDFGLFDRWRGGANGNAVTSRSVIAIRSAGSQGVDLPGRKEAGLPGSVKLAKHPGWSQDGRQWRPLLAWTPPQPAVSPPRQTLILWPPAEGAVTLNLLPDSDPGGDAEIPPLLQ